MKRINKKLLEAVDKLIAKYSGEECDCNNRMGNCPLCDLYYYPYVIYDLTLMEKRCKDCPNYFFGNNTVACFNRGELYEKLDYRGDKRNYPTLKQFWTDYKSLYLQRTYSNSEIMEILIKPFKEEKK